MKKLNQFAAVASLAVAGLIAGAVSAHGQSATITSATPDLLMGFQVNDQTNGTGATTDLELDLGYTATSLVAAAISDGGSIVLGGTNFQTDLSANDLGATYGANWYTRGSGSGKLTWSIFGADDTSAQLWTDSLTSFNRANFTTQDGFDSLVDNVYSDLSGATSTVNSNEDFTTSSTGDGASYSQAIGSNDWNYAAFTSDTEIAVGNNAAIPFYSSPVGSGPATKLGTFSLSNGGVLTFTVVPEPSTWASIVLGAAGLLLFRRRRLA